MDDETMPRTPSEEPMPTSTPEVVDAAEGEQSSAVTFGEATQPMITETTLDEMATVTITPDISEEATQVTADPDIVTLPPQSSDQGLTNVPQPSQPSFTQVPAQVPTPRKRSTLLWMILIALVAFLLGNGSALAYMAIHTPGQAATKPQKQPTIQTQQTQEPLPISSPNVTLHQYCDGIDTDNAQEIYDTFSKQAQAQTSVDGIQRELNVSTIQVQNQPSSPPSHLKYGNCTISNIRMSGSLAVATVTAFLEIPIQGSQNFSIPNSGLVSLVLENQQWKVDFSDLIQPSPTLTGPNILPTPPVP